MARCLILMLLWTSFSQASPCHFTQYLNQLVGQKDPHHVKLYYQYGTSNIPTDVYKKAIAELPVLTIKNLETDIIEYYRKATFQHDGSFKLIEPHTKPSSGATVYMIQKNGKDVAVAKIFGEDYHALFREATASDYLKRHGIESSNVFNEATLLIDGTPQAFSFLTLAKGKDINLEIEEVHSALQKLSEIERENFSRGIYKDQDHLLPRIQELKNQYNQVVSAAEKVSKNLGKLHDSSVYAPEQLAEYNRRREFLLKKTEKNISDFSKMHPGDLFTDRSTIQRLIDRMKAQVEAYQSIPTPSKLISVIHGDAHTGNFIFDDASDAVRIIDNQSLVSSFASGAGGKGVNESTIDLALFLESLAIKSKNAGFTDREIRYLQQKTIRAYLNQRSLKLTEIDQSLNFHRLRFDLLIAMGKGNSLTKEESMAAFHELLARYELLP